MGLVDVTYRVHQLFRAQALTGGAAAVLSPRFPCFGASAVLFAAKCTNAVVASAIAPQMALAPGSVLLASGNSAILDNWGSLQNLTPADMSNGYLRAATYVDQAAWGTVPFLTWYEMLFSVTPNVTGGQDTVMDLDAIVVYATLPRGVPGTKIDGTALMKDLAASGAIPS